METIVPSANVVTDLKDGILKSVSTTVTEVLDSLDINSPPAYALALSHIEQTGPRGWSRPAFFFETPNDVDPMEAVEIFRKALEPTKLAIPSLACEIVPFDDGTKPSGKIALKPSKFGSLVVKDLRGTGMSYKELREQNFPQVRLEAETLFATGIFPTPGAQQPVLVAQLNIVEGGLIMGLSAHHAIFDAQGINEILRVWAQNCHHVQNETIRQCSALPIDLFDKVAHYPTHKPTADKGRPEHHPEILIAPEPVTFGETAFKESHRTRVYRLSPKALAELKNDCTEPGKQWISTNDAACALIWRSVIRAQMDPDQVTEDTLSHASVNVDIRTRSDPPLSKHYPGGMNMYARPGMKLRDVVESTDLAPLARAIRAEVDKRDGNWVDSLVTLLDTVPGFDHVVATSFPALMQTDILITTWYKLDIYDLNWGPALGRIERVRFTKRGLFNGLTAIYPQVTEGQLGMEVGIGLDRENFQNLDADPIWNKYAVPTGPAV